MSDIKIMFFLHFAGSNQLRVKSRCTVCVCNTAANKNGHWTRRAV